MSSPGGHSKFLSKAPGLRPPQPGGKSLARRMSAIGWQGLGLSGQGCSLSTSVRSV